MNSGITPATPPFRVSLISRLEIRATLSAQGIIWGAGPSMKRFFLMAAMVTALAFSSAATTPARAGGGDVAAGLIGGLAAGTIIGAAVTAPRYYGPPPVVCSARAILLLDARTAGVGPIPRRVGAPGCQSVRVGSSSRIWSAISVGNGQKPI